MYFNWQPHWKISRVRENECRGYNITQLSCMCVSISGPTVILSPVHIIYSIRVVDSIIVMCITINFVGYQYRQATKVFSRQIASYQRGQ